MEQQDERALPAVGGGAGGLVCEGGRGQGPNELVFPRAPGQHRDDFPVARVRERVLGHAGRGGVGKRHRRRRDVEFAVLRPRVVPDDGALGIVVYEARII